VLYLVFLHICIVRVISKPTVAHQRDLSYKYRYFEGFGSRILFYRILKDGDLGIKMFDEPSFITLNFAGARMCKVEFDIIRNVSFDINSFV
jgi:hypothetical protein